jgi:triosephosphate isomerase
MFLTTTDGVRLAQELRNLLAQVRKVDIGVFPSALLLSSVAKKLEESNIIVGAQNVHAKGFGAFTGENSVSQLKDAGATWCLVGHSERRKIFGETDADCNRKTKELHAEGVNVIFCLGETIEEREGGTTFKVLERQLRVGLEGLKAPFPAQLVLAYEPVWAIGTGRNATPEQVEEVHCWIRDWLKERFGGAVGETILIQYGGSVKPENAAELLKVKNVDGALVGGASLKAESFVAIVKAAL